MLRLNAKQRAELSETFRELANLIVGAMVVGQFVGQQAVSWWLLVVGLVAWVVLVSVALSLGGR